MKRGPSNVSEYIWKHAVVFNQDRDAELKRLRFMVKDLNRRNRHCYTCKQSRHDKLLGQCTLCGLPTHCDYNNCKPTTCGTCQEVVCGCCALYCGTWTGVPDDDDTCMMVTCVQCANCIACYGCMTYGNFHGGCVEHPLKTHTLQNGEVVALCVDCGKDWPDQFHGDPESPKNIAEYRELCASFRERINLVPV